MNVVVGLVLASSMPKASAGVVKNGTGCGCVFLRWLAVDLAAIILPKVHEREWMVKMFLRAETPPSLPRSGASTLDEGNIQ